MLRALAQAQPAATTVVLDYLPGRQLAVEVAPCR